MPPSGSSCRLFPVYFLFISCLFPVYLSVSGSRHLTGSRLLVCLFSFIFPAWINWSHEASDCYQTAQTDVSWFISVCIDSLRHSDAPCWWPVRHCDFVSTQESLRFGYVLIFLSGIKHWNTETNRRFTKTPHVACQSELGAQDERLRLLRDQRSSPRKQRHPSCFLLQTDLNISDECIDYWLNQLNEFLLQIVYMMSLMMKHDFQISVPLFSASRRFSLFVLLQQVNQ